MDGAPKRRSGKRQKVGTSSVAQSERLKEWATAFRDAIVSRLAKDPGQGSFEGSRLSELLGHYLREMGVPSVELVAGWNESGEHRAWVEVGDLIIDPSPSDVAKFSGSVIVTEDPSWHQQFRKQPSRRPANINALPRREARSLWESYQRIRQELPNRYKPRTQIALFPPFKDWKTEEKLEALDLIAHVEAAVRVGVQTAWPIDAWGDLHHIPEDLRQRLEAIIGSGPNFGLLLHYSYIYSHAWNLAIQTEAPRSRDIQLYWHQDRITRQKFDRHLRDVRKLSRDIADMHEKTILLDEYMIAFLQPQERARILELPATLEKHAATLLEINTRFGIPERRQIIRARDNALLVLVEDVGKTTGSPHWPLLADLVNFWLQKLDAPIRTDHDRLRVDYRDAKRRSLGHRRRSKRTGEK